MVLGTLLLVAKRSSRRNSCVISVLLPSVREAWSARQFSGGPSLSGGDFSCWADFFFWGAFDDSQL